MLFSLGQMVITRAAAKFCADRNVDVLALLVRHSRGDCGDMDAEDKAANRRAISDGSRIFSSYTCGEEKLWIITDAEDDEGVRRVSTVLLPSDY